MNLELEDVFAISEATTANEMIEALDDKVKSATLSLVYEKKKQFLSLPESEQEERRSTAKLFVRQNLGLIIFGSSDYIVGDQPPERRSGSCPSCDSDIIIQGKIVHEGETKFIEGEPVTRLTILPISLNCQACGLDLQKNAGMIVVDRGKPYNVDRRDDIYDFIDHTVEYDLYDD